MTNKTKKIIITALLTAALVAIPTPVLSATTMRDDGNEWLSNCNDNSYTDQGWCLGYIQGLNHGYDMLSMTKKLDYFCLGSRQLTLGQMRDIVKTYLYRNPAKRSDAMMIIYIASMQEAFPCKQS